MTEGYPQQWQNDVQTGAASGEASADAGRHEASTGWGTGASAPEVSYYGTEAGGSGVTPSDDSGQSKTGAAKEQASAVGQGAAQAGQQVASVAKDQAQNVVAEAGSQAKDLLTQARSELTEQAGTQQQRLAQGLRALGDELQAMTQHSESPGVATDLAKQASTRTHDAASWLESREPGSLMSELQSFARQRPGVFLALAAGAGLVAGRLGRGVKDASSDDSPSASGSGYATSYTTPSYTTPPASGYTTPPASGYPTPPASGYTTPPASGYPAAPYTAAPGSGYPAAPAPDAGTAYSGFGTDEPRPFASSQDAGDRDYPAGGAGL